MPPPVITTVPLAGWVTDGSASGRRRGRCRWRARRWPLPPESSSHRRRIVHGDRGSSTQVTVIETVAVEPPGERVGEGVGGGSRVVAVVRVGLVGEAGAAAGDHDRAVGRLGDRRRSSFGPPSGRCRWRARRSPWRRIVLRRPWRRRRRAVGGSSTQVTVTATVARRAAVEGVGEGVGRAGGVVAVVGVRLVGEAGAAAGDDDGAVGRLVTESLMVIGPPSTSVSLASTSIGVAGVSFATVAASFTATGDRRRR